MSSFTIGKFQVVEPLGKGAHSTIMHVRRAADSTHYALKVVVIGGADEQKFLDQAEHEFRVAQMLDHPNLIKIYALELQKDWLFRVRKIHMLIEYVNGKTLDQLPRVALPRLVQIFERIAAGLVHMHRRNVFHADLKPNNVMLSRTGEVKIIDYGLAWIKGEGKGRVQGTPEYRSPCSLRPWTGCVSGTGCKFPRTISPLGGLSMSFSISSKKRPGAGEPRAACGLVLRLLRLLKAGVTILGQQFGDHVHEPSGRPDEPVEALPHELQDFHVEFGKVAGGGRLTLESVRQVVQCVAGLVDALDPYGVLRRHLLLFLLRW
jgi:tRNA A-37 threonylcarbamoyl transferase component Bud32